MKQICYILALIFPLALLGQGQAANWYFGFGAGIRFNQELGTVASDVGSVNTFEGCSSISDDDGNLLFTTDGTNVYDRNHSLMPNGSGLFGNPSSSQSAIIVPKPRDPNIYYIFTVGTVLTGGAGGSSSGLNYSEVDMRLNGGRGDITAKNIELLIYSSEKVSAVLKDCQTGAIWVVALGTRFRNSAMGNGELNAFYAFEVTDSGVNPSYVRSVFLRDELITDPRGYLKLSPDGSKLAAATVINDGLFLYDFNRLTGEVSNEQRLIIDSTDNFPYGIEFSPDSRLLYVSSYNNAIVDPLEDDPEIHSSTLIQFNVSVPPIEVNETQIILDKRELYRGALQLGPDGRIYRALSTTYDKGLPYLGVINNPNQVGIGCNYRHNAIKLSSESSQGLPPFIQSFFNIQIDIIQNGQSSTNLALCGRETFTLKGLDIPGATYTWKQDDILLTENSFTLDVTESGHYEVLIEPNNGECNIEGEAFVAVFDRPTANTPEKLNVCDTNNDSFYSFDLTTMDSEILGSQDPMINRVHYYPSKIDADNDTNEIFNFYRNNSNPQEIFVRVAVDRNVACYAATSFLIEVFDAPKANFISDFSICDDILDGDATNGRKTFDLSSLNSKILGSQNSSDFSVTYHRNQDDADLNNNALPYNYYNEIPFQQTIFIRVENNKNTDCFDTTKFTLTLNPLPEYSNTTLVQCDEDGIKDGQTTFNLLEANDQLTNNKPNVSVKFFNSLLDAQNNTNDILNPESFKNDISPQLIYVQVIDNSTNCFNIAELVLEVSSTRIDDYFVPPVCDELNSEDGINSFDLSQITADIQFLNGISYQITYYETYADALSETNELTNTFSNSKPYSQTIFARVENNNACYGIAKVILTINKLPNIKAREVVYYCLNYSPDRITINAGILNDNPDDFEYKWVSGESTYEIQINQPGNYTVTVTNANGCSKERTVVVRNTNTATFSAPPYTVKEFSENNMITVFVTGGGTYEYALFDEYNKLPITPFQESNVFENVIPGVYTIQVQDINNDCGVVIKTVSVLGFPKFFTPNNDGVNDIWQVYGISQSFQPNSKIYIYNRYGKLLKEISPLGEGWNGTLNGQRLPSDDYWFTINLEDGRIFKNHFTLKN